MSVTITVNQNTFVYDYIIVFETTNNKVVYKPTYINQLENIETSHYNCYVVKISYTYRLSHYEKWTFDQALRNHDKIEIKDEINGFECDAWITAIETEWNPTNHTKPWKYTIRIISDNIKEVE